MTILVGGRKFKVETIKVTFGEVWQILWLCRKTADQQWIDFFESRGYVGRFQRDKPSSPFGYYFPKHTVLITNEIAL
jgi:hypothetical protein